jgi:endonuclease/exonuclease/phosphatase family metal-dependent hydrolase
MAHLKPHLILLLSLLAALAGCAQPSCNETPAPPQATAPAVPSTISIATFNIEQFSDGAQKDFDSLAQICGRYDIVAIQEVRGQGIGVEQLAAKLGRIWVYELSGVTGNSERFAYLYRTDRIQFLGKKGWISFDEGNPPIAISRVPFYAYFKAGNFDFILVTVHLFYSNDRRRADEIDQVIAWYKYFVSRSPEKDIIFLGDFNEKRGNPFFAKFASDGSLHVVTADEPPTNIGDTERFDHFILNGSHTREFLRVGVFKFDEELFDNNDSHARRAVSNHRPVNAEFGTDLPDDD